MRTRNSIDFIKWRDNLLVVISKILCFLLLGIVLTSCASESGEIPGAEQLTSSVRTDSEESTQVTRGKAYKSDKNNDTASQATLEASFLKVGKADAIVLICQDKTMVIDCGEEDDGKEVLSYLKSHGVTKVDVLLITHFDKDHVGGADTVVEGIQVKRILLPAYTGSGTEYADFMDAISKAGIDPVNVTEKMNFTLGSASVCVEPPASFEIPAGVSEYDNDFSLITTVEFEGKRLVFTGDSEKKRIREWIAGGSAAECDVLKIPHHGVYNKALDELLSVTKPSHTVICDSKKNPADSKTLELIREIGANCMQTQYGDITITCSHDNIEIHQ